MNNLTPTQIAARDHSIAFRAHIAEMAARVVHKQKITREIPNTPFGVPKIAPRPAPRMALPMEFYYQNMWFWDLVDLRERRPYLTISTIQGACCDHFKVTRLNLISARRTQNIVAPRQIAMYLCKTLTPHSLPIIGRRFGNRDHTTVLHATRKIGELVETDSVIREHVEAIKRRLFI